MYEINTTNAIILNHQNRKEADRRFRVLTAAYGLIWANASGVRLEHAKNKHFLQLYQFCDLNLVQGKTGWRITGGASAVVLDDRVVLEMIARLGRMIERLVTPEDYDSLYYDVVRHTADFARHHQLSDGQLRALESLAMAQILIRLGYFSPDFSPVFPASVFAQGPPNLQQLDAIGQHQSVLTDYINQCIDQTQLQY